MPPKKKGFKTAFGIEIVTEIEALLGTGVVMWRSRQLKASPSAAKASANSVSGGARPVSTK